jgi:hypothetical protein
MWSHLYSWLVSTSNCDALVTYLDQHSLMGRWMPEARELTNDAFLGEIPWAEAACPPSTAELAIAYDGR